MSAFTDLKTLLNLVIVVLVENVLEKRAVEQKGKKPFLLKEKTERKGRVLLPGKRLTLFAKQSPSFSLFPLEARAECSCRCLVAGLESCCKKTCSPKKDNLTIRTSEWLPFVYIMIGNTKKFFNGTLHEISSNYLPGYLKINLAALYEYETQLKIVFPRLLPGSSLARHC